MEVGTLVEPLTVARHAVKVSKIQAGQSALILGAGPIGLAVLLCLQAHNVKIILVSEISNARSSCAGKLGATHVFDARKDDVGTLSRDFCQGLGPHVVFDCAGVQQSMDAAFASVHVAGSIVNIASWKGLATVNPNMFLAKQLSYVGSQVYCPGEFQEVIDAIASGKIKNPERLITTKISLEEAVVRGFQHLIRGNDDDVKILISSGFAQGI